VPHVHDFEGFGTLLCGVNWATKFYHLGHSTQLVVLNEVQMPLSHLGGTVARYLRRKAFYRRLKRHPDAATLLSAVRFSFEHAEQVPLQDVRIRHSIAVCAPWHFENAELLKYVLSQFESFLFSHPSDATALDWQAWIRSCRSNKLPIDIRDPSVAKAISDAERERKLQKLASEERTYLLSCFMRAYGDVLSSADNEPHPELLPVLLEFAAIGHLLPTQSLTAVLEQWAHRFQTRPRCLTATPEKEAFQAPIRGVGSPNGVVVTTFSDDAESTPNTICIAGTTSDPKFNVHLFNTLFATALACESEPTFVTTGASVLTLGQTDLLNNLFAEPLLPAVIGPAGAVEPDPGIPSVGIGAMESMLLAGETFSRLHETTGLLTVLSRNTYDGTRFDKKLWNALSASKSSGQTVVATSAEGEPSTAVHLTPLIHRNESGELVPVEIEIPYRVIGGVELFRLLRRARSAYMRQLIEETRRRLAMAWQVYNHHRRILEEWLSLSELEKANRCEGQGSFTITGRYDFRRAVVVPLPKPKRISMREYEDTVRPGIVQQAKYFGEAFQQLCDKLRALDAPGGRADTLTFKLLIDSMIRKAPLQVESQELQGEYRKWMDGSSDAVWAAVDGWAREHKISPALLASDSVVFNCSLNVETNAVMIRPWIAVDLHDFTATADQSAGTVAIYPAGRARKLTDAVIRDRKMGINNLITLNDRFNDWMRTTLQPQLSASGALGSESLLDNRRIRAVVEIYRARSLLSRGLADEALARLTEVRNADLAAIYFWSAVACELRAQIRGRAHVPQYVKDQTGRVQILDEDARRRYLLGETLEKIRVALGPQKFGRQLALTSEAAEYLSQLRSKDPKFIESFRSRDCELPVLEQESLALSKEEVAQVKATLALVGALECLHLAQELTRAATQLPSSGTVTTDVKKKIERLLALTNRVSACEIPEGAQINTLKEFLVSG